MYLTRFYLCMLSGLANCWGGWIFWNRLLFQNQFSTWIHLLVPVLNQFSLKLIYLQQVENVTKISSLLFMFFKCSMFCLLSFLPFKYRLISIIFKIGSPSVCGLVVHLAGLETEIPNQNWELFNLFCCPVNGFLYCSLLEMEQVELQFHSCCRCGYNEALRKTIT